MQKFELLNSEGPILKSIKFSPSRYDVIDRYNCLADVLTSEEMQEFVHGDREIIDSKNKTFKYVQFPCRMKPDLKQLDEFIGIDTTGLTY